MKPLEIQPVKRKTSQEGLNTHHTHGLRHEISIKNQIGRDSDTCTLVFIVA